ncbi:MAG: hypothetical protein FRX48_07178 [Lasallia pustulata]|uniref:Ap4A phosphorylase 1/2 N-terminal domain-containing protein n=1 Tax=Lasallia pustulata TaxID=136370 RepID=A0A5M8PJ91_9LECA|nr:MAG: hypothetical protein FRX48_07178 [Lasallia pustulata]
MENDAARFDRLSAFHLSRLPAFLSKPQLDHKPATAVVKSSPLQSDIHNDDPDFLIGAVGSSHTLILNRYCVYRPQFILVTNDVKQRQSTPLDRTDLEAACTLLNTYERRHLVIYNCGKEAGSSRLHKHLQALPVPDPPEWFAVFDEDVTDLARAKLP